MKRDPVLKHQMLTQPLSPNHQFCGQIAQLKVLLFGVRISLAWPYNGELPIPIASTYQQTDIQRHCLRCSRHFDERKVPKRSQIVFVYQKVIFVSTIIILPVYDVATTSVPIYLASVLSLCYPHPKHLLLRGLNLKDSCTGAEFRPSQHPHRLIAWKVLCFESLQKKPGKKQNVRLNRRLGVPMVCLVDSDFAAVDFAEYEQMNFHHSTIS